MKFLWILALWCLAVSASPFDEDATRIHGENGWYVPRINGTYEWMDKDIAESQMEALENIEPISLNSPVKYLLYTRSNPKKGKTIKANTKSINASKFNATNPTRFLIHGWTQSYYASMNKDIRNAWLSVCDCNVIFVDWARARSIDYASSVIAVPGVGKNVANMIDFLAKSYGMSLNNLIVIGHSLGAHIAGYSGKNVKTGKINTIVGLDPALPLFSYDKPHKRLDKTDAIYVESMHTNGGGMGFEKPIGKGSFYPNGGKSQPGCPLDIVGVCAHSRAITYYAEAVSIDKFASIKCKNYYYAVSQDCGSTFSSARMGTETNALTVAGEYYVPVNKKAPFGMLE